MENLKKTRRNIIEMTKEGGQQPCHQNELYRLKGNIIVSFKPSLKSSNNNGESLRHLLLENIQTMQQLRSSFINLNLLDI